MAIQDLSGNFRPPSVISGINLPQPNGRAPSTNSVDISDGLSTVTQTKVNNIYLPKSEATSTDKPTSEERKVDSQIEQLQQFNQNIDRRLQFKVDEELGVTIVRVIDKETDELIRQFPPEELINLSKRLKQLNEGEHSNNGILLQERV